MTEKVDAALPGLLDYAEKRGLIEAEDRTYCHNRLLQILRRDEPGEGNFASDAPLEDLLKRDGGLYRRIGGRLVKNAVILEDNDVEHQLDENVPYQAVTETVANAVLISPFSLFEQAGFSGDVYLGVVGNSARTDMVLRYIDYLTSDP